MSTTHLQQLATRLAPAQAARTQQRYSEQRGGRARRASGKIRHKPLFDDAARLLLTLLYQRQVCSMNVLAELLEVTATCIGDHIKETREVLNDHRYDPGVASIRFTAAADLLTFLDSDLRPARTDIIERLSRPELTGLTHTELHALTQRLAAQQAAQAERFSHKRRGGPRQPGARGGVFPQKISNSERVLLTILTNGGCAPSTSWPMPSATSVGPPSVPRSGDPPPAPAGQLGSNPDADPLPHRRGIAHRRTDEFSYGNPVS